MKVKKSRSSSSGSVGKTANKKVITAKYHIQLIHVVLQVQQSLKNTFTMKKGQQKPSGDSQASDNNKVTSTVEDSQDASNESHETNITDIPATNTADVSSSSPVGCNDSNDSNQISSKEKLAKFSFEHKAQ